MEAGPSLSRAGGALGQRAARHLPLERLLVRRGLRHARDERAALPHPRLHGEQLVRRHLRAQQQHVHPGERLGVERRAAVAQLEQRRCSRSKGAG